MKQLAVFILFCFACTAFGQDVSGNVKDKEGGPIPFADVILMQQDSAVYKTAYTDDKGYFILNGTAKGSYILKISTLGFADYIQPIAVEENAVLPDIILKESATVLEDVVINSKKPVVKRKIDRLEFNVENTTLSSENAWEILRKTPGVNVTSGGIAIRGSSGILVTINDKKVYLTGTELKNLLENTEGENIKSIEVITNPPARYEAQGSAVLNIKMKKTGPQGYKGSVAGAYVQSMYPKGVVSTNQYYKADKFSVYGGYMFGSGTYYSENKNEARYRDVSGDLASVWKSDAKTKYRALSQNSYNMNAEYMADSLNIFTVGTNGFFSLKSNAVFKTPAYIYNAQGQLDSLYYTRNNRDYPQKNNTINGTYEHKFKDKGNIVFSADYTKHYFNESQNVNSVFSLPGEEPYRFSRFLTDDSRRINLFTAQADYTGQLANAAFEAGLRYGKVDAKNEYEYITDKGGVLVPDDNLTNTFLYDEDIFAGYVSYHKELNEKWSIKAGLRGEYTSLEGNSVTTAEVNTQEYFKIFPTLYGLYKPSAAHQVGLSYGKRIIRPVYGWLNPFRSYTDPYAYNSGDPKLQPAITHNINLMYTLKDKYNFDFYYRLEKDPALQVSYQDYATNTLVTQITNIRENNSFGLDFNTNLEIFEWWQSGIQANIAYAENTFQGVGGNLYTNGRLDFTGSTNMRFTFNRDKSLIGDVNFYYRSPYVQGTYLCSQVSSLDIGVRKTLLKGNAELSLILSDIYRGSRQKITTSYGNQYNATVSYNDTQSFRIQFRYRFGNQKLQNKAQRQTEEQQRLN
ncbi:outer membrane beta-barrel family protein [Flavobacterium sp. MK4S-17]|uniref:outer membrane beta-barrel family protein n=1 Tax=Flavobacterium sp. MK4S-17 TaxID=2543737 RepID=UPI0013586012|nr:outer membrane beta-barrel family protein [Flavobacterium sp. MK4S-17]